MHMWRVSVKRIFDQQPQRNNTDLTCAHQPLIYLSEKRERKKKLLVFTVGVFFSEKKYGQKSYDLIILSLI